MSNIQKVKLTTRTSSGKLIRSTATLEYNDGRIWFLKSPFSLKEEIKAMRGSRWHGRDDDEDGRKIWSIEDCPRNRFQLGFLMGEDVYAWFDRELTRHDYSDTRCNGELTPLMLHQCDMSDSGLTYHYQLWAAEMGTGKTLSAQKVIEKSGVLHWWWVGPKSSLPNIRREFAKWGFDFSGPIRVEFITYDELTRRMDEWKPENALPQGVIFDESSRLKGDTSQRTQAAQRLADLIREKFGFDGYVIEMSGTPSPKSPLDWWSQCLSADTWVLTSQGPRQIAQLIGVPVCVRVRDQLCQTRGFYQTGQRTLFRLQTVEGYSVKGTPDHRFLKANGEWCQLANLQAGDMIALANHGDANWIGEGTFGDGYLLGFLVGDGHVYEKDGNLHGTLAFFGRKRRLVDAVKTYIPGSCRVTGSDPLGIHNKYVSHLVRRFGFGPTKDIPTDFEATASSDCLRGFLRGLFDADGSVDYNRLRVTLSQVKEDRVLVVQRLLSYFGIRTTLQRNEKRNAKPSYINGRKINSPSIVYILHITGDDAVAFGGRIGFNHPDKAARLSQRIAARHHFPPRMFATVANVAETGTEPVYDVEVPGEHCFAANGLLAHNCEIAWPGFLREGSRKALEQRCGFVVMQQFDSGIFPKRIGWKDDQRKCKHCGLFEADGPHELDGILDPSEVHPFEPSFNEVAYMHERLKGLVVIKHKKDCLTLPDKRYRKIICRPNPSVLRVAQAIVDSAPNTITGLTLLRELSDGFQYRDIEDGEIPCPHCPNSCGEVEEWFDPDDPEAAYSAIDMLNEEFVARLQKRNVPCTRCGGSGTVPKIVRATREVPCPKEKALKMLLDECEENGRIVVFAGFTGSVDRVTNICRKEGWSVLRCDGRGFEVTDREANIITQKGEAALDFWADRDNQRVAFVAHPESGGMSLTLVESRMIVYWSNSWKPEYRIQSEDRCHRKGMDENQGLTIVDLIHLPSDDRVLEIIRNNRRLELLTMGEVMGDIEWEADTDEREAVLTEAAGENLYEMRLATTV